MRIVPLNVPGPFLIETEKASDDRGFLVRLFEANMMREADLETDYPEHSLAFNERAGTVRGLHYQIGVFAEAKIIRCIRGALFDVAVDVRRGSSTFGAHVALRLEAHEQRALYIPKGFAHGYQTLEDRTEALYLISAPYDALAARGAHHADPDLGIAWPLPVSCVSPRDAALPLLAAADLP